MPRKHNHNTMKGGFWDTLTQGLSDAWEKTKKTTTGLTGTASTSYTPPATSYTPPAPTPTSASAVYGGKTRSKKKRRHMKGGFKDNTPTTGLAAHAAPFSGPTAQPHNWVGGKTKKRYHKRQHRRHTKSCRHKR